MFLELFGIGSVLAFILTIFAFEKRLPFANISAAVLFIVLALLIATQGLEVKTAEQKVTQVDGNTITSNITYSYTTYTYSTPFVFAVFWIYLGIALTLILYTFVY